ncbi:MAG TPA: lycopene cyclase domain-containing protein [Propionibacteriaceae bacterium]|jgi:lycopene cyclase domain-containing protein|nr:lycopene cyclase domain-containing protein [Propionibacteriaceae bacterium]HBY22155.1 lycopene cyclase domain-containing protein [Propionibacteriaceae bacterium]
MGHAEYLVLLGACLLLTLPLEFALRARVYRRPLRLLLALAPTLAVFVAWDVLGIVRGHWWYSPDFTTGIMLGLMPLEELLFFLVVPVCGLLTYEAVGYVLSRLGGEEGA